MQIGICEDEKIYQEHLGGYLREYFEGRRESVEIQCFPDGKPFLEAVEKGEDFDLVFLDIQLQSSDGVETAKRLREMDRTVPIVFVTGLEDRVFEGYEVAALDYVIKTDMRDRLFKALDRFMANHSVETLTVPIAGGDKAVVRYEDICWIQSEGRGCLVGTETEQIHSTMPVGQLSKKLPAEQFVEAHKSVYVQTRAIRRIGADTVEMKDGSVLPLSRRRRKAVMAAVMNTVKE